MAWLQAQIDRHRVLRWLAYRVWLLGLLWWLAICTCLIGTGAYSPSDIATMLGGTIVE